MEKIQADEGGGEKAARTKIRVGRLDELVETWDTPLQPGADSADEKILVPRHLPQHQDGPVFLLAVKLWEDRDRDVTFLHSRGSAL